VKTSTVLLLLAGVGVVAYVVYSKSSAPSSTACSPFDLQCLIAKGESGASGFGASLGFGASGSIF
jgi:hypothetical protein